MKRQSQTQATKDRSIKALGNTTHTALPVLASRIRRLQGPILVVGAHEFAGANLLTTLLQHRQDVYGTTPRTSTWRLKEVAPSQLKQVDLLNDTDLKRVIDEIKPRTVLNFTSYETIAGISAERVYKSRFLLTQRLLTELQSRDIACFLHVTCVTQSTLHKQLTNRITQPLALVPETDEEIADEAAMRLISSFGRRNRFPGAVVRVYSPYGPKLDPRSADNPMFSMFEGTSANNSENNTALQTGLYVDDATDAIVTLAAGLDETQYGATFDVCSDESIAGANSMQAVFNWQPPTETDSGIENTLNWFNGIGGFKGWQLIDETATPTNKKLKNSITAVIACYNEGLSIPIMYQRLRDTFVKLGIDYEIIFVNNASKDNSEEIVASISAKDPRVIGITHSRPFDSQASFKSGMEIATKEACVLLDGDLQDPPEMIEQFVEKWREGYDVVYGRRVKRDAPWLMQLAYKGFYRAFAYFSYISMPQDAGDFSLIDSKVVKYIVRFPERDLFLRGLRAYAGFKQVGVDYVRPERMFGKTSNNLFKNLGWAKKGIFSFTKLPLDILSYFGGILLILSVILGIFQVALRLIFPDSTAWGVTTILVTILFFGAINLFAISLIGEYIAKIFDEVKQRPIYIRHHIIKDGEIQPVTENLPYNEFHK